MGLQVNTDEFNVSTTYFWVGAQNYSAPLTLSNGPCIHSTSLDSLLGFNQQQVQPLSLQSLNCATQLTNSR